MIETVQLIMEREIKKLEKLSKSSPEPLSKTDAQILTDYLKTIVISRKDDREAAKLESLQTLSADDLQDLARQALAVIDEGDRDA